MTEEMILETINGMAATLISLAVSYIPGLESKYQALSGEYKRVVMLGLLVLSTALVLGVACSGFGADFGLDLDCNRSGIILVMRAFMAALVSNQATYLVTPKRHAG